MIALRTLGEVLRGRGHVREAGAALAAAAESGAAAFAGAALALRMENPLSRAFLSPESTIES